MADSDGPTLADQVTRLYELIGGFHATHLIEVARELGAWEAITAEPGVTSERLAGRLGTDPFYTDVLCRTAFAIGLLERREGGWLMAPHFNVILGDPTATSYLGRAARVHLLLGEDYASYPDRFRHGRRVPFGTHGDAFIEEIGDGLRTLPRIFIDFVLPRLPELTARLEGGARVLDLGCGSGWALVELARRFPRSRFVGVDVEPHSIAAAKARLLECGVADRCEAHLLAGEDLGETAAYDVVTSFLVVHEIEPAAKDAVFRTVASALVPDGFFVIFDEAYPETDEALRTMPAQFAALAQWFELTWGNIVDTPTVLRSRCVSAGLDVVAETTFSRFAILLARRPG